MPPQKQRRQWPALFLGGIFHGEQKKKINGRCFPQEDTRWKDPSRITVFTELGT